jgi:quercetin dioxygenase-like cupin family protein
MNIQKIVDELKLEYPRKNIVINTPENPTEIVCEIESKDQNPEKSVAIAVLGNSIKHFHRMGKETYEVIKGNLEINKAGKTYYLSPGEKIVIEPGEYHTAKGSETWVRVTSEPAWSFDDHLFSNE